MADEINKVILLDVRVQSEEAEKRSAEITSKLATFKQEYSRLQKELKNDPGNKHLAASLNAVDLQMRALNKEQGELRKQAQLTNTVNTTTAGTIENLRAQLGLNTIEWNKLTEAERTTTQKGQALRDETKRISDELKKLEGSIGDTRRNVGNYKESLSEVLNGSNAFTTSLNGMREMLAKITASLEDVDVNTDEFKQGKKVADDLKLSIQQATGAVNEFGEREPKNPAKKAFEDAFQSAGAAVNSIQLLNLLIGQNGDASVLQAKAIQTVAVAQTVANIVRSKGEVLDTIALAKTKLLTIAQRVYAVAVGQSTGALKVLRIAMLATVAGAVIVGIGILAQKMGLFGKATKDAADDTTSLAAASKKAAESIQEEKTKLELLVNVARDESLSKERRQRAVKALNDLAPEYLGNLKLETINTKEAQTAIDNYVASLEKKAKSQALFEALVESEKKLFDIEQERSKIQKQKIKDSEGDFFAEMGRNAALKEQFDLYKENLKAERDLLLSRKELINQLREIDPDAGQIIAVDAPLKTEQYTEAVKKLTAQQVVAIEIEKLRAETIAVITDGLSTQAQREKELSDLQSGVTPIVLENSRLLLDMNAQLRDSEDQLMAARIEGIQGASGALHGLVTEGSRAQKVLFLIQQGAAVAEVIFNTSKALSSIGANLALIPPLLPPGIPNPAFPVAAGIAAVQSAKVKIQAGVSIGSILAATLKEFKAEKGTLLGLRKGKSGVFGGKPHSSGGTRGYFEDGTALEVEEGEVFAVVNKQDSKTLRGLSDINSRHGKSFFREGGMKFQDGGFAARYISNPVINRFEARNNARLMARSVPPQVVTVEDINAKTAERTRVVERANL